MCRRISCPLILLTWCAITKYCWTLAMRERILRTRILLTIWCVTEYCWNSSDVSSVCHRRLMFADLGAHSHQGSWDRDYHVNKITAMGGHKSKTALVHYYSDGDYCEEIKGPRQTKVALCACVTKGDHVTVECATGWSTGWWVLLTGHFPVEFHCTMSLLVWSITHVSARLLTYRRPHVSVFIFASHI